MKYTEEQLDKTLEKLAESTRSPKGIYSASASRILLNTRIKARRNRKRLYMISSAAAIALLIIVSWGAFNFFTPVKTLSISTLAETKTILLPDGSEVMLNRYSTLSYPERFRKKSRDVQLEGEAYFSVTTDVEHPFTVQAGDILVTVLGTQFNLDAYPKDNQIKTTLFEGSVSVKHTNINESLLLQPNESAVFQKGTGLLSKEQAVNMADEIAWKNGSYIFSNLPLKEIAQELSNAFGVEIKILSSKLESFRMTARFTNNESLDEILSLLQSVGNFNYIRNNETINIQTK
ncbi:MAG: FecR domain-containing protein [Bacteroides sp.]|nr:FecR domain-containing protein [Bacteroides sp.]